MSLGNTLKSHSISLHPGLRSINEYQLVRETNRNMLDATCDGLASLVGEGGVD